MDKIQELLTRGVANIIPNKEELKKTIIELAKNKALGYELTKMAKIKVAEFGKERMLEETIKILRQ